MAEFWIAHSGPWQLYFRPLLAHFDASMMRFGFNTFVAGLLVFVAGQCGLRAAATNETPEFQEVYDLIRAHAAGMSDADLNRAAVQGLLAALGPKASLVTNGLAANAAAGTALVDKAGIFEDCIAYLRISRVGDGLADAVSRAYQQLSSSNQLKGVVLDLRFANGDDYAAATATADLFMAKTQPLLDWGNGTASSHGRTNAIQLPAAILVNRETAGAAEALAAVLRETGTGLVLGGTTAGQAMVTKDFTLKDGRLLRIAIAPVTLGDGTILPAQGIKPDIDVAVSPEDERIYYADAFHDFRQTNPVASANLSLAKQPGGTNVPGHAGLNESDLIRKHKEGTNLDAGPVPAPGVLFNEAELVREHKEGTYSDDDDTRPSPVRAPELQKPVVNDPALARALDLLKGLAVARRSRP
jgi:hypothetical protein